MAKLNFHLVTPERTVLTQELESLSCPTTLGQITILPGHISLVASLVPGELVAKTDGKEQYLHVAGGFVEVRGQDEVVVLADAAEHAQEINEQQTSEAIKRAQAALKEKNLSAQEYARVAASLEISLSRMRVARKRSHNRQAPITGEGVFEE